MTVRAAKIEIFKFSPERRDAWKELSVQMQRMQNRLWQIWIVHHANNGSADKLREHFDRFKKWKETGEGEKPQWPCKALDKPLTDSSHSDSFYRILSSEFPDVNARTRGLVANAWQSKLNKRKAANGSLPGWVSILFANESVPSFTRPQPIVFDHQNAKLIRDGDKYFVELRIERLTETGKSVVERCELMLLKRKCRGMRAVVDKCLSGEYAWKGSSLVFDRGKWFALISYEMPKKVREELDAGQAIIIRPGRRFPWRVKFPGSRSGTYGGNGQHVVIARRRIETEREQRKEHYRWAGSNQKGAGRKRAEAVWVKLSSRWKDFVKRYNTEVCRRIVSKAVYSGIGKIIYIQPVNRSKDSRYLSTAGTTKDSRTTWDYFQFGAILASMCEKEGIECEVKKRSENATGRVRNVRAANGSKRRKRAG